MEILDLIDPQLQSRITTIGMLGLISAVLGSLFTEAIKISLQKVITGKKPRPILIWIINMIMVTGCASLLVFNFYPGENFFSAVQYTIVTLLTGWPISILAYTIIIRTFMTGCKIIHTRVKDYHTDAQAELTRSSLVLRKYRSILIEEITLDELQVKLEARPGASPGQGESI